MKVLLIVVLIFANCNLAIGQEDFGAAFLNEHYADSVLHLLPTVADDSTKVNLLISLGGYYKFVRQDSSIYFYGQSIRLAEQIKYTYGIYQGYLQMSWVLNTASNYGKALEMAVVSLRTAETLQTNREFYMAGSYGFMASVNHRIQNDSLALSQIRQSINLYRSFPPEKISFSTCIISTSIYGKIHHMDSVLFYSNKSYQIALHSPPRQRAYISISELTLGAYYLDIGETGMAHDFYLQAIENEKKYQAPLLQVRILNELARFFKTTHQTDSCIYYAKMSLRLCENHQFGEHATNAANMISTSYESLGKSDSALKYMKIYVAAKDSIISQSKLLQIDLLNFDEAQRRKEIQRKVDEAQEKYTNKVRYYSLFSAAAIFLIISLLLYRNNRSKQIANRSLELQKKEIDLQRTKAEQALQELKTAQDMLIQSEKMSSLGELTAGIAHEIQNPLNFVNNFSEINKELLDETSDEIGKGNFHQAQTIIKDIINNESKINHHGKRADAIVKGMMLHSRTSTGIKEPTDINDLMDEYLRLSYHGWKAKQKTFHAILKTDYDPSIGMINIIPQDIGRVFLNVCNNAFYAVSEKQHVHPENYEPTISVKTKMLGNKVEISVADNGNGIPQKYIDKIFLPFFTTKPVGQGIGLGLSMSFDLIKAQGGELRVKTKEGEGAEFLIQLPIA